MLRIQVNLSKELDIAYASALRVDRTTLPICFECQTIGENSVVSFDASFGEHAMMNKPCWADSCFADAKLASPKLAKQTSVIGIGLTMTDVSQKFWVSRSVLFPSNKVSTVALGILFCKYATRVAMSGLECTAAYWRLPQRPLS